MIKEIAISNYRCYSQTIINGFKRINLIGGLNNSGKTILLEAILLNYSPTNQNVGTIKRMRGEESDSNELPEYAWDNFFLNQNKKEDIIIKTVDFDDKNITLVMRCNEDTQELKDDDESDSDFQTVMNDFIDFDKASKSVLHFYYKNEEKEIPVLIAVSQQKGYNFKEINLPFKIANYIPSSAKRRQSILAREYGIAEKKGKENLLLEALRIVDKNISGIKVSVVGGAHLEIKRDNENFMNVSLYGDAINKILTIVLTLINNNGAILLIDEIENGLHYTIQEEFWLFLFKLAQSPDFNVQVFATSHSLEMIQAFTKAANDNAEFLSEVAYLELFRRKNNQGIGYNSHNIETLSFELSNKMPVRGE